MGNIENVSTALGWLDKVLGVAENINLKPYLRRF